MAKLRHGPIRRIDHFNVNGFNTWIIFLCDVIIHCKQMGGQWTHDLFQGRRSAGGRVEGQAGSAKLVISNLDFGVNDEDIKVSSLILI